MVGAAHAPRPSPLPFLRYPPTTIQNRTLFTNCSAAIDEPVGAVGRPTTDTARSALAPSVQYSQSRVASDARDTVTTRWPCDAVVMSKTEVSTEAAAPSVAIHVDHYDNQERENSKLLNVHAPIPTIAPSGQMRKVKSFSDTHRIRDVTTASGAASARSLRPYEHVTPYPEGSESGTTHYGAPSIRSLASIGMGCTDGRKMVIRRVPTSPTELFHLVRPPTWVPLRMKHPLTCHYSIDLTGYQPFIL